MFLLASFLQVAPSVAQQKGGVLKFDREIGIGFRPGDYRGWMSFVAFSPDGTMVASDGPAAADDVSARLTLCSFPDGRLIKRLPRFASLRLAVEALLLRTVNYSGGKVYCPSSLLTVYPFRAISLASGCAAFAVALSSISTL